MHSSEMAKNRTLPDLLRLQNAASPKLSLHNKVGLRQRRFLWSDNSKL